MALWQAVLKIMNTPEYNSRNLKIFLGSINKLLHKKNDIYSYKLSFFTNDMFSYQRSFFTVKYRCDMSILISNIYNA